MQSNTILLTEYSQLVIQYLSEIVVSLVSFVPNFLQVSLIFVANRIVPPLSSPDQPL